MPAAAVAAAAVMLLASTSGCSFLFVKPPPPREQRGRTFDCTESQVIPVVDMFGAVWPLVRFGIAYSASDRDYADSALSRESDMVIGLALGALFVTSAAFGLRDTNACREALAENREPIARPVRRPPPKPALVPAAPPPVEPAPPTSDGGTPPPIPAVE